MWIRCGEGDFAVPCSIPGKYMSDWARETLYPAFQWIESTPISNYVSGSMVVVPFAGVTHLLSLALLGGCILMVDMRVLGFGVGSWSATKMERTVRPMLIAAIVAVLASGFILFFGQVLRVYSSPPFWVKITTLVAAIVFTFTVRNKLIDEEKAPSGATKALGIAAAGTWIFFFLLLTNLKAFIAALVVVAGLAILALFPGRSALSGKALIPWIAAGAVWIALMAWLFFLSATSLTFGAFTPPPNPALMTVLVVGGVTLALAALAFVVSHRTDAAQMRAPGLTRRLAAAASIGMWLTVAVGGRWIAFH